MLIVRAQPILMALMALLLLPGCVDKQEECNKAKVAASEAWGSLLSVLEAELPALVDKTAEADQQYQFAVAMEQRLTPAAFGAGLGPGSKNHPAWVKLRAAREKLGPTGAALSEARRAERALAAQIKAVKALRDNSTQKGAVAVDRQVQETTEDMALPSVAGEALQVSLAQSGRAYEQCVDVEP